MFPGRGTRGTIKASGEDDGEAAEDRDQEETVSGGEGPQQTVRACSGNEAGQVLTCAREVGTRAALSVTGQVTGVFFCNSGG